jgi:hypothetical protein
MLLQSHQRCFQEPQRTPSSQLDIVLSVRRIKIEFTSSSDRCMLLCISLLVSGSVSRASGVDTGRIPVDSRDVMEVKQNFGRELTTTATIDLHYRYHAPRTGIESKIC